MIEGPNVDRSLSRMLDELGLRVRRSLIHQLESSNLWIEKSGYETFLQQQRTLGMSLRDKWLSRFLGQEDYLSLTSGRAYGAVNAWVPAKIPLVLAFGYELGAALIALSGPNSDRRTQVAVLCALFNLGISLFDFVLDQSHELMRPLACYFDVNTLRKLDADRKLAAEFYVLCEQVKAEGVRILLKIIASFFVELHKLYAVARQPRSAYDLLPQLERAYRAELCSASLRDNCNVDTHAVSKDKSTLPFIIMGQIAYLGADVAEELPAMRTTTLAAAIAEIFWLTDDLMDIVGDLRSGAVNFVLTECGVTPIVSWNRSQAYRGVMDLLSGSHIENTATGIASRLISLDSLLNCYEVDEKVLRGFRRLIISYVQSWIT